MIRFSDFDLGSKCSNMDNSQSNNSEAEVPDISYNLDPKSDNRLVDTVQ